MVRRSLKRPGSLEEAPFTTIHEGESFHYNDDEVAEVGSTIRYMVHGMIRGRIEHQGATIRNYEIVSRSMIFPGVLIWQEVANLRSTRRDRALELTWQQPPGVRQVVIERWPGGPGDSPVGITALPANAEGRLLDGDISEGMVFTYRVRCVYDGPEGEFRTPGVSVTDGIVAKSRLADDKENSAAGRERGRISSTSR